ncbi:MAG: DUF1553 domain-containing protein [Pedosphaera sp.]|nr:DUF1553 domain-containing protein [Pedosphaera sp.]
MLLSRVIARFLLILGFTLSNHHGRAANRLDFNFQIQPLLSDRCYTCHGPDEKQRKGKLRLDTREGAFGRNKDGKKIITPGTPGDSELIRRIFSTVKDEIMPPPESNLTLSSDEKELLRRWVEEGAEHRPHWAFNPIRKVTPPTPRIATSVRNPIDSFVLARLEKAGMTASPEADRERLLRRVTFDLTGLPPTLPELNDFLADASPDAYDTVVTQLLKSAAFGERMANDWLDVARYADTHGFQADRYRPMWPWRDWAIGAFNRDLPFDQFITWQLAGDLLPSPTREQRLATAFNRLHMQNEEGGIVEEEFRVSYVVDRVNTVSTAFLGLTSECSRCHDHKYDPLLQKDFYSLFSFFQNIDESGQSVYFGDIMPVPTMLLSTPEQETRLAELRRRIAAREAQESSLDAMATPAFEAWLTEGRNSLPILPSRPDSLNQVAPAAVIPGAVGAFGFDERKDGKYANGVEGSKPAGLVDEPALVAGVVGAGVELDGENGLTFPGLGHFGRADAFSISIWLRTPTLMERQVVVHHSRAWMDAGSRGYELLLENGHPTVGLHHMWPGNSLKLRVREAIPTNTWTQVAFTYDGSSRASGLKLYINGRQAEVEILRNNLWKDITYAGGEPDLAIGSRMRDSGFRGGQVDEFRVYNRALTALEMAHLAGHPDLVRALSTAPADLTAEDRGRLLTYYAATVHPGARQFRSELAALRREQSALVTSIQDIMVMDEMPEPKKAYVLRRGAYDQPTDEVTANTPKFLPPFPAGEPRNRLGLARWLLSEENPLTARVAANRAWQLFFGKGIVETADNFGSQGAMPTHPELLDWLADTFRSPVNTHSPPTRTSLGWSWKELCRLIVTSATYRQSSRATPGMLARDPGNSLLAHGPSRRLTAEMLRDQALAVSGLLSPRIGGPSVKPYQPAGVLDVASSGANYDQAHGDDLHRRSLYSYWKRTVPHPAMMIFDAADRSNCSVRRQSTSTPLQPLVLLSDPQIVEAARFLAQRMLQDGGRDLTAQLTHVFRLATSRRPTDPELSILARLYREQREGFAADPQAAARLLAVGESANDPSVNPIDLAAGTILAKALLNHDEALARR